MLEDIKPGTEGIVGMESSSRMKIQTVKIVQPTSLAKADCPEGSRPGQLYCPNVNLGSQLDVIPIFAYNSRTMFSEGSDGAIECSSLDSKTGSKFGDCNTCPHLPWRDDKKQLCMNNIVVYAVTSDLKRLVRIIFAKTSETAGKFLVRQATRSRNLWDTKFTLSTESKNKSGKSWLQYKVAVAASGHPDQDIKEGLKILSNLCMQDYKALSSRASQELVTVEEPKRITESSNDGDAPDFPF